jgi:hypothetical protein
MDRRSHWRAIERIGTNTNGREQKAKRGRKVCLFCKRAKREGGDFIAWKMEERGP